MSYRLLFILTCLFCGSRLASSKLLVSSSTSEAGQVKVFSDYWSEMDKVNFTISFQNLNSPMWLAIGFNTESKMLGTSVMVIKYDKKVVDFYNGLNQGYTEPFREKSNLTLISEINENEIVTIIFQRNVILNSSVNPASVNNLKNCYKVAVASGRLLVFLDELLPHSKIPVFSPECVTVAEEKQPVTTPIQTTLTNLNMSSFVYTMNISVNLEFTNSLLDDQSKSFLRFKASLNEYINASLFVKNIFLKELAILGLSNGSIVSISRVILEHQIGSNFELNIVEALKNGDKKTLEVINERIFVFRETSGTTYIPTEITTPVPLTSSTAMAVVQYYAVEYTIESNFTDSLKDSSSEDFKILNVLLETYTLSGFDKIDKKDMFNSIKIESLNPGSIIAKTILKVNGMSNTAEILNALKNGDSKILPVNKDKFVVSSLNSTTDAPSNNTTKNNDSSSVSAVAIAVPIVVSFFVIIVIIVAFCVFRRKKKSKNSYIIQTAAERNRTNNGVQRNTEIPQSTAKATTDDDDLKSAKNSSLSRYKYNDSPPKLSTLKPRDSRRESEPPTYSMTDGFSSTENSSIKKKRPEFEDVELKNMSPRSLSPVQFNDTTDMESSSVNLSNTIRKTNNRLFQSSD